MKILTVIGARPQFIKAATVSRAIQSGRHGFSINEVIVHTGQHYDQNMSEVFFSEMDIPRPNYNLCVHGSSHGVMTGKMLEQLDPVISEEKPDVVLVYGDTNSTIAGALAAVKLHIPIAHIEAGLRSFNMKMPEEVNRILTDRVSTFLYCPTTQAVTNLENESFRAFDNCHILHAGDVMYDAALYYSDKSRKPVCELPDQYILMTVHRAENTSEDSLVLLKNILDKISIENDVVFPIHPRTKRMIDKMDLKFRSNVYFIDPVGYLEMIYLIKNSLLIMTDSGGLQKEAYFFNKPCLTMRKETEWIELVECKANYLVGLDYQRIEQAIVIVKEMKGDYSNKLYGDGTASEQIINHLGNYMGRIK